MIRIRLDIPAVLLVAMLLAACGTTPKRGGYYQNDGPPDRVPSDIGSAADAVPSVEPIRSQNARPYSVLGRSYTPMVALRTYKERGLASWYGKQFHGEMTASGERYDMYAMTAAHKTLPIPSYARVTSIKSGRSVIVRINDRGPFHDDRIIDLSYAAAVRLGGPNVGTQMVEVELLLPDEIAQIREGRGRVDAPAVVAMPAPSNPVRSNLPSPTSSVATVPAAIAPVVGAPIASVAAMNTTELPATSIAPDPQAATVASVAIQVGAYSVRSNADAMQDRIARELPDLDGRISVVQKDGLYRVRVGPYVDSMVAIADRERLRDRITESIFLVDAR